MTLPLLLIRPQPGNDASAAAARAMGIEVIQCPLFVVAGEAPQALPPGPFDALLLTSANGARFAGDVLRACTGLPLYAVGEATAQAARIAGHGHVITGGGDGASTARMMVQDGHRHVLHPCGAEVRPFDAAGLRIERHIVYRAGEADPSELRSVLEERRALVAAIHSPRAGARLAALLSPDQRAHISLVAISAAAAQRAGSGWASLHVSTRPDDTALLACAKALCISA